MPVLATAIRQLRDYINMGAKVLSVRRWNSVVSAVRRHILVDCVAVALDTTLWSAHSVYVGYIGKHALCYCCIRVYRRWKHFRWWHLPVISVAEHYNFALTLWHETRPYIVCLSVWCLFVMLLHSRQRLEHFSNISIGGKVSQRKSANVNYVTITMLAYSWWLA